MKKRLVARCLAVLGVTSLVLTGCNAGQQKAPGNVQQSQSAQEVKETDESETVENSSQEETTDSQETKKVAANPIKLPDYTFTEDNFPRMDGSTSMVPLAKAVAGTLLNVDQKKAEELCSFNRTTQSFRNLSSGEADILIVGEPNAKVYDELAEAGFKYKMEAIATEALVFVVNKKNPVDSLTTEQIRDIYLGKIKNWKEVGGNDEEIIAFQRNEGAGSQALMQKHVMKGEAMQKAPGGLVATEMGELMTAVKSYDNSANAIGYSVYYYANDMKMADDLKIIAVDGVKPNADTIRKKEYPHLNSDYCVIPDDEGSDNPRAKSAKVIYDWLISTDGQRLIASKGYVSVKDVSEFDDVPEEKTKHNKIYTRLDDAPDGTLTSVEVRDDYGMLIPYSGSPLYVDSSYDDDDGYSYIGGYMSGFFDTNGRLVTDPVYGGIHTLTYYDPLTYNEYYLPFYSAEKYYENDSSSKPADSDGYVPDGVIRSQVIAKDGSFVSPEYAYVAGMDGHVLCKEDTESNDFVIYDTAGKAVMTYEEFDAANDGRITEMMKDAYPIYDVSYGEGYYVFWLNDNYYYVDETTKKIVMGPYEYAQPFDNGIAYVRKDGYAAMINKQGQNILGAGYSSAEYLANGNKLGVKDNHVDLIDPSGYLIKTIDNYDTISKFDWGFYLSSYIGDSKWNVIVMDNDGNELYKEDNSPWLFCDKIPVAYADGTEQGPTGTYSDDNTGIWLMNIKTGKRTFIKGASYAYPFYTMNGIADVPFITVSKYDNNTYKSTEWIYDEDLNERSAIDGSFSVICDKITNEWMLISYENDGSNSTIFDKNLNELRKVPVYPSLYNGYAAYIDGNESIGLDPDGNMIFCYEMTSLGEE